MKLGDAQLAELERIREWACCLEPERRFMAEVKVAALKREMDEWRAYHRDATELAEAVSMSGNMRISPSDRAKMNTMTARLGALLTGGEDETE